METLIAEWRAAEAEAARLFEERERLRDRQADEIWYQSTKRVDVCSDKVIAQLGGKVYRLPSGKLLVPVEYQVPKEYEEYVDGPTCSQEQNWTREADPEISDSQAPQSGMAREMDPR